MALQQFSIVRDPDNGIWTLEATGEADCDMGLIAEMLGVYRRATHVPDSPAAPVKAGGATKKRAQISNGEFIIMATTSEDELYQLEHSGRVEGKQGGAYCVYRVDKDGRLQACKGAEFPAGTNDRETGIRAFQEWALRKGFDVKENEFRKAG